MNIRFAALALPLALLLAAATALPAQQSQSPQTPAPRTHVQNSASSRELNTDAYIQLLRADLSAKTEQIVRDTMQVNDQQSATFWPIYRQYQTEQSKLITEKLAIVTDYATSFSTITDAKADQLAEQIIQLDEKRMALREKYYATMKKALTPIIAVRFFQVEHQLQLIVDLQISANLPIIEENDSQ
jgi:Spy/CpxP family protein refolding chaperone